MDYDKFYSHTPYRGKYKEKRLKKQLTQKHEDRARHYAKLVPIYMLLDPEQMVAHLKEHREAANKLKRQAHEVAFVVACKLKDVGRGSTMFYHLERKYQHGIIDTTRDLVRGRGDGEP